MFDAFVLVRLAHFAAAMSLFGTSAFLWALAPAGLSGALGARMKPLAAAAVGVAAASAVAWLLLEAGQAGEGWGDAVDPATVSAVLFDTAFGRVWQARLLLLLALLLLLVLRRQDRWGAMAGLSALLLGSLGLVGHAAMQEGAVGLLHRLNHAAHLISAGAWMGGLMPLLPCLAALRDPMLRGEAAIALRRFSAAGHVAVALVIATGVVNTALVLKAWPLDWSSPYQALLAAKIGLVAILIGVALVNRYVFVPRLRTDPGGALRRLVGGTLVELVVGAGVLALVSVFAALDPA